MRFQAILRITERNDAGELAARQLTGAVQRDVVAAETHRAAQVASVDIRQ